jgi:glycosyltransferase WbpL
MTIFVMFVAAVITCVLAAILTPLLAKWAHRRAFLDIPNHRSSHVIATPRIGGVALVCAMVAGVALWQAIGMSLGRDAAVVLVGAVAIAALGLADDVWSLSALVRLLVQFVIAAIVVQLVGPAPLPWFGQNSWFPWCVSVLWIVMMTNAYNFMDGIDGIAGAQALVAGIGWTTVALLGGLPDIAALSLMAAAASGGFLLHNWDPAKVFMGDAGSGFFGFLFAALPLLAPANPVYTWCALLLLWPFVFDTTLTLIRRASRFENVLTAHRSHIYQRLVIAGCSHQHVTLVYAGLAIFGAMAAILVGTGQPIGPLFSVVTISIAAGALWWYLMSRERKDASERTRSEPRERSEPAKRLARERVGESEGR